MVWPRVLSMLHTKGGGDLGGCIDWRGCMMARVAPIGHGQRLRLTLWWLQTVKADRGTA